VPARGWWHCAGWAARARPAWRWNTRTGIWARSGWRGSCPRRTRRCWRPGSVSWPLSSAPPIAGIRWPRCTGCWPAVRCRGCWCSTAARDLFAALLPVYERVLSAEHPDTLAARHNLAAWTGHAGDPTAARDLFAALLPVYERVIGAEHPSTLTARHNLAHWTGEAGDAGGARDQHAALLPMRERVIGPEHPDTLTTRADLAYWTGQAERGPRRV